MEILKGDSVAFLNYHFVDVFNNPDATGRKDYYSVFDLPTVKIMGKRSCVNLSANLGCLLFNYGRALDDLSPCTLNLQVDYDSLLRYVKVRAQVTAVDTFTNADAHLRYAIAESHIYYPWQDRDSLQHVVRKMLPDYNGIPFSIAPQETFLDSQTYILDSEWNDKNCYVVAFLQADAYQYHPVWWSAKRPLYLNYVYGDANGDGAVTAGDVVYLIGYLYRGGPAPNPYEAGDPSGNCAVDAGDVVYLISYLYRNGEEPLEGCSQF
jgi:hypothetical protein